MYFFLFYGFFLFFKQKTAYEMRISDWSSDVSLPISGDVADLMKLSDTLATLNVGRYAAWKPVFDQTNSRQAALAFNGDVYEGLDASSLSDARLQWAQEHVAILSGLYGVLRPLYLIRPYRLEMVTRLQPSKGKNMYDYWGDSIARYQIGRASCRERVCQYG